MESKGRLVTATLDISTHKTLLTFQVEHCSEDELERLRGADLRVKAVKYFEKRSNDANAYHWKLCSMIAAEMGTSLQETHKWLMLRYGTIADNNGVADYRIVPLDYEPAENEYWKRAGVVHLRNHKGEEVDHNLFWVIKESHLYNTKEMSVLIDGTISEAKELGLETLPPRELEKMMKAWKGKELWKTRN